MVGSVWRTQILDIHVSASEGRSTGLQQTETLTVSFTLSMEVVRVLSAVLMVRRNLSSLPAPQLPLACGIREGS